MWHSILWLKYNIIHMFAHVPQLLCAWQATLYINSPNLVDWPTHLSSTNICHSNICRFSFLPCYWRSFGFHWRWEVGPDRCVTRPQIISGIWAALCLHTDNRVDFKPVLSGVKDYSLGSEMILLKGNWVEGVVREGGPVQKSSLLGFSRQ